MIRGAAIIGGGVALAALIVLLVNVGPWTRGYNYRLEAKAAGLESILGRADVPLSKFQVHCSAGVVTGLELFDD